MPITLPDYTPPDVQRAAVAAGFAPLVVLMGFAAMVVRLIDVDTGFALFAACTVWVMYEMHEFERLLDAYNCQYVSRYLAWRTAAALRALLEVPGTAEPTRAFVMGFLDGERVLLHGQPRPR
ncbi:conserved hypothetical protein [Rubrivivax sp. A210]|uniref:hypothetical protein n=1 Tax=Rubrivivax sp. A210 TaxID=2772301 RepID=UPI00191B23E0|nr:hypothetical protein [Rubrivivax sp. A210]CAD5372694.1 conserved hypothetical protein [Rubrivivax sp. A210]